MRAIAWLLYFPFFKPEKGKNWEIDIWEKVDFYVKLVALTHSYVFNNKV